MSKIVKEIRFLEGVTVTSESVDFLSAGTWVKYANDAAYITAKETAAEDGDSYYNTTSDVLRLYKNGAWSDNDATDRALTSDFTAHTSATVAHGTYSDLVGASDTATLSKKTFSDPIAITEVSAPATPSAGNIKIYAKTDKKVYYKNSDGTETEMGSSGSVTTGKAIAMAIVFGG